MISQEQVGDLLNSIDDPCSVAAGCRAGLREMGLVKSISIAPDADGRAVIDVELRTTDAGCLMSGLFVNAARNVLSTRPDVAEVTVRLCHDDQWTEADLEPGYRERLANRRALVRAPHPEPANRRASAS